MNDTSHTDWWVSLKHGGLLIGPSALREYFPEPASALSYRESEALRRAISRWESGTEDGERGLVSTVLEELCGFNDAASGQWLRGNQVPRDWTRQSVTGEAIKPRQLWQGPAEARLPVFVETGGKTRLGIGRGRRTVSRALEWLRATGEPLAVVTNLRQWRLLYAGLDFHAWAESDIDLWFEGGLPGPQITALRTLLSPHTLVPEHEAGTGPLLAAIQASRKGQAELSGELGERVRRAVERLIDEHRDQLGGLVDAGAATPRDIYLAGTRIMMRLVVVLFAESRDLLPRDNPIYHGSYGLEGLRDSLVRAGGGDPARLRQRFGAWPRILGLMQLVREGSHHPDLEIPRYGGELFAPGDPEAKSGISRALAVFENPEHGPSDATVHHLLTLLTRSHVKVRQGRQSTRIETAVDFSNLSSEYIGILYEGLLDFELRRSAAGDPMVFLAMGKEPVLPLSRLEGMNDAALRSLLESVKKDKDDAAGDEVDEEEAIAGDEPEESDDDTDGDEDEVREEAAASGADEETDDAHQQAQTRALEWARRAAAAAGVVRKPRGRASAAAQAEYEAKLQQAASKLIKRVVVPGEWFLVRWGGTRKGRGTFYTRPQLAVPTVQRTLRPLACTPPDDAPADENIELLPASRWRPRRPEEILALKVCDPAMGSGSFLVGALRYLTDTLYDSLFHHGRIREEGDRTLIALLEGADGEGSLADERLPARPDDEHFEPRLRARLKRYIVERCLYGVDIDPLAVELCPAGPVGGDHGPRAAFRIPGPQAQDRQQPGRHLVRRVPRLSHHGLGARGRRQGPRHRRPSQEGVLDQGHQGHAQRAQARAGSRDHWAAWLVREGGRRGSRRDPRPGSGRPRANARPSRRRMSKRKAAWYREHIADNPAVGKLKEAMDAWCATLVLARGPAGLRPDPEDPGSAVRRSDRSRPGARRRASASSTGSWSFPTSSPAHGAGFDAVLGNPPWDIQKPNSKEYFSNIDPLYRSYGKQEALRPPAGDFQRRPEQERDWLLYNAGFKAFSNWCKYAANPCGDPTAWKDNIPSPTASGETSFTICWRDRRLRHKGYADPEHPFRHQGGGDINTYKLFLEYCPRHPAARGTPRHDRPFWHLHRQGHHRPARAVCRGMPLALAVRLREPRRDLRYPPQLQVRPPHRREGRARPTPSSPPSCTATWTTGSAPSAMSSPIPVPRSRSSAPGPAPSSRSAPNATWRSSTRSTPTPSSSATTALTAGASSTRREFHMTNDSNLFKPRPWWEERGYQPDEYGRWIGPEGTIALPLFVGKMVDEFNPSAKAWISGKGRGALWDEIEPTMASFGPEYLMDVDQYRNRQPSPMAGRVGLVDITTAVHRRTSFFSSIPDFPCGHLVPVLQSRNGDIVSAAAFCGFGNSLCLTILPDSKYRTCI